MAKQVRLFVEGVADKKFISDYIQFLIADSDKELNIISVGGWQEIHKSENQFKENTNDGGVNLVIFDSNSTPVKRKKELLGLKSNLGIEFELFLFPNNKDAGTLESLLCEIINNKKSDVFDCFDKYVKCINKNSNYNLPDLKSKIYAYLESVLPKSKQNQKKDGERDYKDEEFWDLSHKYLNPLKKFLINSNYDY